LIILEFGCPIYIHTTKDKRKKLDPVGMKDIFVGYISSSKAYITYIKEEQRIEAEMLSLTKALHIRSPKTLLLILMNRKKPSLKNFLGMTIVKILLLILKKLKDRVNLCNKLLFQRLIRGQLGRGQVYKKSKDMQQQWEVSEKARSLKGIQDM